MVLFLGMSADVGDFQPITIPDDYPLADMLTILPEAWWGGQTPPSWVASDNELLAEGASQQWGGLPIYQLGADGFPVAPAP